MIEAETARVVISLHGIRTRGKWQKELAPLLNQSGFTAVLSDYGYFNALELLLPWSREKRVSGFWTNISESVTASITSGPGPP